MALLDWSINNQILTGSYDRNVVVWNFDQKMDKWKHELVMLENNRAVLAGGWSKNGKKFSLGVGSHKAMIGYFNDKANWWDCKRIRNFKSSVVASTLHPSGRVVATGSTDFSFKIVSCWIEEVDAKENYKGVFDEVKDFGEILYEFSGLGWVETLAWSPSGQQIAFACKQFFSGEGVFNLLKPAHDLSVNLVKVKKNEAGETDFDIQTTEWDKLPFLTLLFKSENEVLAGGYDYNPVLFREKAGKL